MSHQFGGPWTEEKLKLLKAYLPAFTTALSKQSFDLIYIDAFAGTGERTAAGEAIPSLFGEVPLKVREGSVTLALKTRPAFDRYVFVERSPERLVELRQLVDRPEFGALRSHVDIMAGDANKAVIKLCDTVDWRRSRAVMFLDPYGGQVNWSTIEVIGGTEAIDLWVLVPISSINRMLARDRTRVSAGWEAALDRILGARDWRDAFYYRPPQLSLDLSLPATQSECKVPNAFAAIERYVLERLRSTFSGGVAPRPRILANNGKPLYMLAFAVGNPNPKARNLALKIAGHILKKG